MAEVEDIYALQRLHITYSGNSALAFSYLGYAKARVRDLLTNGGSLYQVKSYTPQKGVLVRVRLDGEHRYIHIEATRGCTDRLGFLLSRRVQAYDALYNDGKTENINPVTGSPRPDPDPAVRTKGYKVPPELLRMGLARSSASKYSGLMRLAVACHHAAGRDSPFRYEHAITHGIVKKTVRINNQDVDKHWVVEVRAEGVFAAPIANTGKCCDSWDVSKYMPRVPPNPRPAKLSLLARFGRDKSVQRLVDSGNMATCYADGSPFYPNHGWAFSASGSEAQAVVQFFVNSAPKHYECSRWKLTFEAAGENLSATLTKIESRQKTSFKRNSIVWTPISFGVWAGSFGAAPSVDNPVGSLPSQDAPVAVYYVGELEMVLRWTYRYTNVPLADNPANTRLDPETGPPTQTGCPFGPSWPNDRKSTVFHLERLTSGQTINAHTEERFGFSCPAFGHVGVSDSYVIRRDDMVITQLADSSKFPQSDSQQLFASECWYFDAQGNLIKSCFYVREQQARDRRQYYWDRFDGTEGHGWVSSVVLFDEEREAFMGVRSQSMSQSGLKRYVDSGPTHFCMDHVTYKTDSGPCPYDTWTDQTFNNVVCGDGVVYPLPHQDPAYTSSSSSASAAIVVADKTDGSGSVFTNYNLGTFLLCDPTTKPFAESNVRAMHGNLYDADPKVSPPLQRSNMVYLLDNKQIVIGGFPDPVDPVAFVGRA